LTSVIEDYIEGVPTVFNFVAVEFVIASHQFIGFSGLSHLVMFEIQDSLNYDVCEEQPWND